MNDRLNLGVYFDTLPTCNWDTPFTRPKHFDDMFTKDLDDLVKNYKKASIKKPNEYTYQIPQNFTTFDYYNKCLTPILEANQIFQFDLQFITENLQYRILSPKSKFENWHRDAENLHSSRRKLVIISNLSSPDDYEGGEIEIWLNGDKPLTLPKDQYTAFIFPSFYLYKENPVTKGIKKELKMWVGGTPFR